MRCLRKLTGPAPPRKIKGAVCAGPEDLPKRWSPCQGCGGQVIQSCTEKRSNIWVLWKADSGDLLAQLMRTAMIRAQNGRDSRFHISGTGNISSKSERRAKKRGLEAGSDPELAYLGRSEFQQLYQSKVPEAKKDLAQHYSCRGFPETAQSRWKKESGTAPPGNAKHGLDGREITPDLLPFIKKRPTAT